MLSSLPRRAALFLASALALASCGAPAMATQQRIVHAPVKASKPGNRGLFNDVVLPTSARLYGTKAARVTAAQQKRAARKARGVARNRRHHR